MCASYRRAPAEWAALALDEETGERAFVPAFFLRREASGSGEWTACQVSGYDAAAMLFDVTWSEPETGAVDEARVSRINLCFAAEDPFIFSRRLRPLALAPRCCARRGWKAARAASHAMQKQVAM